MRIKNAQNRRVEVVQIDVVMYSVPHRIRHQRKSGLIFLYGHMLQSSIDVERSVVYFKVELKLEDEGVVVGHNFVHYQYYLDINTALF